VFDEPADYDEPGPRGPSLLWVAAMIALVLVALWLLAALVSRALVGPRPEGKFEVSLQKDGVPLQPRAFSFRIALPYNALNAVRLK
jgi:hypothetical protein